MSTLSDLVARHSQLDPADADWLHLLVGDWQLISDLAFADLVLWLPMAGEDFIAIAQCRPTTGATVNYDDIVGTTATEGLRVHLGHALAEAKIQRLRESRMIEGSVVREEVVPVTRTGRPFAVVARQTNLGGSRTPSRLELNYVEAADELLRMVAHGEFPSQDSPTGPRRGAPRVGDGLIRLDAEGDVLYASPNASSCFHRLGVVGNLVGESLIELATELIVQNSPVDESMPLVVMGRAPWRTDLEKKGVTIALRAVPLTEGRRRTGAILLCRDVSELRRGERELITKEATIREIHHRVKNNLQTVAALLRLQARRMTSVEARSALEEAMRRVATIALVHETLSQTLDETVRFDDLVSRSLALAADVATAGGTVRTVRTGEFGMVPAGDATALALVLTELVTNAVQHGLPAGRSGTVEIHAQRDGSELSVIVTDDGVGLPDSGTLPTTGLGAQIVQALVHNELRGSIQWRGRDGGGTEVMLRVTLRDPKS